MARVDLPWNPFDPDDPGPCIDVVVANSPDVIDAGRAIGLEYPEPRPMRALLDTGASVTVINKVFANSLKLFQTSAGSQIRAIGATHKCGEHAGSISFPGTNLRSLQSIPIISADFIKEPFYAILIGRDVLRNWVITFSGRSKRVTIEE